MTFLLSNEGILYEKDMGENTAAIAASIQIYNPDDYWTQIAKPEDR